MNLTGDSNNNVPAVFGQNSNIGDGVIGDSKNGEGVRGVSHNSNHGGVVGVSDQNGGTGVFGTCDDGHAGVAGKGVWGSDTSTSGGYGVIGESKNGEGVHGDTNSATAAAIAGIMLNPNGTGAGVYGGAGARARQAISKAT